MKEVVTFRRYTCADFYKLDQTAYNKQSTYLKWETGETEEVDKDISWEKMETEWYHW
jgi:hypothetical protein